MSLFFTQGHRGICSKTRLIPGPQGPQGISGTSTKFMKIDCNTDNLPVISTPLQALKQGESYIFSDSTSTLVFKEVPTKISVFFHSEHFEYPSSISFSLLDSRTNSLYILSSSQDSINPNLFVMDFMYIIPDREYILYVNGYTLYKIK